MEQTQTTTKPVNRSGMIEGKGHRCQACGTPVRQENGQWVHYNHHWDGEHTLVPVVNMIDPMFS